MQFQVWQAVSNVENIALMCDFHDKRTHMRACVKVGLFTKRAIQLSTHTHTHTIGEEWHC